MCKVFARPLFAIAIFTAYLVGRMILGAIHATEKGAIDPAEIVQNSLLRLIFRILPKKNSSHFFGGQQIQYILDLIRGWCFMDTE